MQDFRTLKVWEKSHELTLAIYRATRGFPSEEQYGVVSQLRRAAASIAANIAEGCCRDGEKEFGRFLQIAMGSASEVEYHVLLSKDLGYLDNDAFASLADSVTEVKRMLASLIGKLRHTK